MSKHKRLKPVRGYLCDKGEMIEQMFSSIPIVEVRNMVPIKLQGMPLHELKAECLVELLEMSDREILSILDGKKTRDPSSSESEAGGVVVISDDETRIKKEKRSDRYPAVERREDSDGSSTERSTIGKKKNKRRSKEDDDQKRSKKKRVDTKPLEPSTSKDKQTGGEIPRKKRGAKPSEKPKQLPGEVVVLDDLSSDDNEDNSKKPGEKSLLDLLELEMRARAIRSLLKKEEETQALKVLSEYKDEPDDLIPVEIAPPQVDLLSDSDEDLKKEEPDGAAGIRPSTYTAIDIEGGTLSSKDTDVLDNLLGIENNDSEVVEVIEIDDASINLGEANPLSKDGVVIVNVDSSCSTTVSTVDESEKSIHTELVEETDSQAKKTCEEGSKATVKVERASFYEPVPPIFSKPGSNVPNQRTTVLSPSAKLGIGEVHTPELSACTSELPPLLEKEESNLVEDGQPLSLHPVGHSVKNVAMVGNKESTTSKDDNVIAASDDGLSENRNILTSPKQVKVLRKTHESSTTSDGRILVDSNCAPPSVVQVEDAKLVGIVSSGGEGAGDTLGGVSNSKSRSTPVPSQSLGSPVECSKPLSAGDDFHSNFEEDALDYDYDPSLHATSKQSAAACSIENTQSSLLCPPQTFQSGLIKNQQDFIKNMPTSDIKHFKFDGGETTKCLEDGMVELGSLDKQIVSCVASQDTNDTSNNVKEVDSVDDKVSKCSGLVVKESTIEVEPDCGIPLRVISDNDSDSIQAGELPTGKFHKEKPSDQVDDHVTKLSQKHHFLVNDALGSVKATTLGPTPKSQEHNKTPMVIQQVQMDGGLAPHIIQDSHSKLSNEENSRPSEEEPRDPLGTESPKIVFKKQGPPDPDQHFVIDGGGATESNLASDESLVEKERLHFLATGALESSEVASPRSIMKIQEHNNTYSVLESQYTDAEVGAGVDRDYHDKLSCPEGNSVSKHESLDLTGGVSPKILVETQKLFITSMEDKEPSSLEKGSEFEPGACGDVLGAEEQLGFSEAVSPRTTIKSQEHNDSTTDSPQSPMGGEAYADQCDNFKLSGQEENNMLPDCVPPVSSEDNTQKIAPETQKLLSTSFEAEIQHGVSAGMQVHKENTESIVVHKDQNDFLVDPFDCPGPSNLSSTKSKIMVGELFDSTRRAQDGGIVNEEEANITCKTTENMSNNENQHFLVAAALDSLDLHESKTSAVNQELNESPLSIEDDVFSKIDIHVHIKNSTTNEEPGVSNMLMDNDEQNLGNPAFCTLKSELVSINQGLLKDEVNDKIIQLEDEGSTLSPSKHQLFVNEALGSTNDQRHGEDSVSKNKIQPCSDHGITAFVGGNSLETQKNIEIIDGIVVSTFQEESFSKWNTFDCVVVSSEDESESKEVTDKIEDFDELIVHSLKNNPCNKDLSPTSETQLAFSQCESQKHSIQGFLIHQGGSSSCDVILSSDENTFPETERMKETTSHQGDYNPESTTCLSRLDPSQPSLTMKSNIDTNQKRNSTPEIDEMIKYVFNGNNGEGELTTGVSMCEGTSFHHGLSTPSSASSSSATVSSIEPMQSSSIAEDSFGVGNKVSAVIEIDDEDSGERCNEKERNSLTIECLEETSSVETNASGNVTIDSQIIEIDEESDDSSSEEQETDSTSEDSLQSNEGSYMTVHSISDDENAVQSNDDQECTTEEAEKRSSTTISTTTLIVQSNSSLSSEGLLTPVPTPAHQKIVDGVINISDSESENSLQAGSISKQVTACTDKGSESSAVVNSDHEDTGMSLSVLSQDICSNVVGDILRNSQNNDVDCLQNFPSKDNNNRQGYDGAEQPGKDGSLPEKELEEGEIEESDSLEEKLEDDESQYLKVTSPSKTSMAQRRSHKRVPSTSTDSESSSRRSRPNKRSTFRTKKRRLTPEQDEAHNASKYLDQSKYQDASNCSPIEPCTTVESLLSTNISKQTSGRMADSDTIVIDDDDNEIVQDIAKQMPPEILELDDSDETKTNWTARWLESRHVKKVVTTSKILTNARKKLKMKLKVKEIHEDEAAPPSVDVPQLIGSVEEYHRLVKEGLITSSSKLVENTDLEKVDEAKASNSVAHNASTYIGCAEVVASSTEEIHNKAMESDNSCDSITPVDLQCENITTKGGKTEGKEIGEEIISLPVGSASLSTTHPALNVPSTLNLAGGVEPTTKITTKEAEEIGKCIGAERGLKISANSDPQPSVPGTREKNENEPVTTDPLSSCINSFYAIMNPKQVFGNNPSSQSLFDIPYPPSITGKKEITCNSSVSTQLPKSTTSYADSTNESTACGLEPQVGCDKGLEGGEMENDGTVTVTCNDVVDSNSPIAVISSGTSVRNTNLECSSAINSSQPVSISFCGNHSNSKSVRSGFAVGNVGTVHCKPTSVGQTVAPQNSRVGSFPSHPSSILNIVQCCNTLGISSTVHSTHTVSTVSHSTLSSVIPPSYTVSEATPMIVNSGFQNPAPSGVCEALPLMHPIQAPNVDISNLNKYGAPPPSLAHPQMSVNVNSTLQMYDPYYSWAYSQGLSGSLNNSYGALGSSQDAGAIYKQWGEYYRKLMEACQDSAVRASANNMFGPIPPKSVDNKGYSWVFERPNQAPPPMNNPEPSNIVPSKADPVQSPVPGREWNYRYGLKGLLNEHFITPGTAPAPSGISNPQHVNVSRQQLSRRGKRKRKKRKVI